MKMRSKEICCDLTEMEYDELIFLNTEGITRATNSLLSLLRLFRCPTDCDDPCRILRLISAQYTELIDHFNVLVCCFKPQCFECSPYRIYSQLLESITLLKASKGILCYIQNLIAEDEEDSCRLIELTILALDSTDTVNRFLENINREYTCERLY